MTKAVWRNANMRHAQRGERVRKHRPELLRGEVEHGSGTLGTAKSDILKEECPHIVVAEADALVLASLGLGERNGAELGHAGTCRSDVPELDAAELADTKIAIEANKKRDGIGTMTMKHPAGSNDLRHHPWHRGALDRRLDAPPPFEGTFGEVDMVTENGVEEETAVKGGSGVGTEHVSIIEVLDVVVEVKADAGRRRKGSRQAAMARRRPGHEGAGMLLIKSVRRHRNTAGLEVCGLAQPLARMQVGPGMKGGRGANGSPGADTVWFTGHRGCGGRKTVVQSWSGDHENGNQRG